MNEIRFLLTVKDFDKAVANSKNINIREDKYYKEYRARKYIYDDSVTYMKIDNTENGKSVKVKTQIDLKEYLKLTKKKPLIHIRMESVHPEHKKSGEILFFEKVTVVPTGQVYYTSEYEYGYNGDDSLEKEDWLKLMRRCKYITSIEDLGNTTMAELYFMQSGEVNTISTEDIISKW